MWRHPPRPACLPPHAATGADPRAAGLLIECRGRTKEELAERIAEVEGALAASGLPFGAKASEPRPLTSYPFIHDSKQFKVGV